MRDRFILALLTLFTAAPAGAQISVDLHALEALPRANSAPTRPPVRAARPKVTLPPTATPTATPTPAPAATPAPAVAATPTPTPTPPPELPTDVPPTATVNPPPAQTASVQPAPEPPKQDVINLRIPFDAEQTELSKDANNALEGMLHTAYATGAPMFTVVAYASGKPDDVSASRRVSLARAMAARNALMAQGVPSRRITVRALGNQAGDGPPDRVDITATPSTAP